MAGTDHPASVPCLDHDPNIAAILQAVLSDQGYQVSCLHDMADDAVRRAVGRLEPDVVLLDSGERTEYGAGWELAAALRARQRPVPVVMFTAHQRDLAGARA